MYIAHMCTRACTHAEVDEGHEVSCSFILCLIYPRQGLSSSLELTGFWLHCLASKSQGPSCFNSGATGAAAIPNNSVDAEDPNKDPHDMQQILLPTEPFSRPDCKHILTSTQYEPCPLLVKNWLLLVSGCFSLLVAAFASFLVAGITYLW